MIYSLLVIASTLLLSHVEAVFDATSNSNVIYYWLVSIIFVANKKKIELVNFFLGVKIQLVQQKTILQTHYGRR